MASCSGWLLVLVAVFALAFTLLSAGCASGPGLQPPATATGSRVATGPVNEISIRNFTFSPVTETIKAGTSVTWTNRDAATHSVMSDDGDPEPFATAPLVYGAARPIVFSKPGTYAYHCEIHPSMKGKVIVEP